MVDKIKPLKIENASLGGSETDPFPTEADPTEDYVAGKGFAFENNDSRLLDLSGSGELQYKDAVQGTSKKLNDISTTAAAARYIISLGYFGAANNKWLERPNGSSTDTNPFVVPEAAAIRAISLVTKKPNSVRCTATIYKNGVALTTITITDTYKATISGLNLSLATGDEVSAFIVQNAGSGGTLTDPNLDIAIHGTG